MTSSVRQAMGRLRCGSPKSCMDVLESLAEAGVDEMILFHQGGTTPHDKVLESIRNFGKHIIPKFN